MAILGVEDSRWCIGLMQFVVLVAVYLRLECPNYGLMVVGW